MQDFMKAIEEVKPEYGVETSKLDVYTKDPMIDYGSRFKSITKNCHSIIAKVKEATVPSASLLLYGKEGTGKTTVACNLAKESDFPFIKMISSEDLIGKSEFYKVNYIVKCFDDAFKSPRSLIILDELERLVEYVEINKRFNNNLLQALLVLIKKPPTKTDHSICVMATCSNYEFLKGKFSKWIELGFIGVFNVKIEIPTLSFDASGEDEIEKVFKFVLKQQPEKFLGQNRYFRIAIKKLLFVLKVIKKENKNSESLKTKFMEMIKLAGDDSSFKNDALSMLTDKF